ncbi:hypothetical protein AMK21_24520 [Streptomyces sp. CB00316]|nr:hypothetical protein AMK21_24520 [Streptomyces sp. CB00316]
MFHAGGVHGPGHLRALAAVVLDTLETAARARGGPLPAEGPDEVARRTTDLDAPVLSEEGIGAEAALADLVRATAEGAADPADPACVAHLYCPPLAVAAAAELAGAALNPSMDSWDQAPAAGAALGRSRRQPFRRRRYRRPGGGKAVAMTLPTRTNPVGGTR